MVVVAVAVVVVAAAAATAALVVVLSTSSLMLCHACAATRFGNSRQCWSRQQLSVVVGRRSRSSKRRGRRRRREEQEEEGVEGLVAATVQPVQPCHNTWTCSPHLWTSADMKWLGIENAPKRATVVCLRKSSGLQVYCHIAVMSPNPTIIARICCQGCSGSVGCRSVCVSSKFTVSFRHEPAKGIWFWLPTQEIIESYSTKL